MPGGVVAAVDFFFSFLQIREVCSLNQFIWWSNGQLGEGIHKSYVVMKIRWKVHYEVVAHVPI